MRGFLVLVLLALLQWAAAAAPLHGGGPRSSDGPGAFGHLCAHPCAGQSLARATAQAAGESAVAGAATPAQDCASCHAHCTVGMLAAAATLIDAAGSARAEYSEEGPRPSWPERPYRPQWRAPQDRG